MMRFMASIDRHSEEAIAEFKATSLSMKSAIKELVDGEDSPCPEALKIITTIKAHALFGGTLEHSSDVASDVEQKEATGSMDEGNVERCHAEFNQLRRQFGNTRGTFQLIQITRAFHFDRNHDCHEINDEMVKATQRRWKDGTVGSRKKPQQEEPSSTQHSDAQTDAPPDAASEAISNIDDAPAEEAEVEAPTDEEEECPLLDGHEKTMNANRSLRGPLEEEHNLHKLLRDMHTKIVVCSHPGCKRRILGNGAYQIHCHEVHNAAIAEDVDGNQQTTPARVR